MFLLWNLYTIGYNMFQMKLEVVANARLLFYKRTVDDDKPLGH